MDHREQDLAFDVSYNEVRNWLIYSIKTCREETRAKTGVTISVNDVFTIMEAHTAEASGEPHTIKTMAAAIGVSSSTVSRGIRRLEGINAVRLVPDGRHLYVLSNPDWADVLTGVRERYVKSFREVARTINEEECK